MKRLIVWFAETLATAMLTGLSMVGLFCSILFNRNRPDCEAQDFLFAASAALMLYIVESGFVVTSAILGLLLRRDVRRWYPVITAGLFFVHLQFRLTGPELPKLLIQICAASAAFASAIASGWCLKKWGV